MSLNEISKNINKLKTSKINKDKYAEFSTPYILRQDMINSLPLSFWKNKKRKVLEPCCGKGGFLIDIIKKFMENLDIPINNRYKYIVEKILYFGDINKKNVLICKKILGDFKLNYFIGDALKKDFCNFDLIITNPPYNVIGSKETGNTIYQKFIKKSLEDWLKPGGYLLFVTPSSWRKPSSLDSKNYGMFDLMTKKNWMKYLEIHSPKDAKKMFNAATRYDWYLIKKSAPKNTIIKDEQGVISKINLMSWPWLPNFDYKFIKKLLAKKGEETVDILFQTKFDSDKKHMSKKKSAKYKYVCIHSTPKKGITFYYTSEKIDKKPKVIFGDSGLGTALANKTGKYCLTEHAMGIIDEPKNLDRILKVIKSDRMKQVFKACLWSNFQIDWRMFSDLKKDFYKMI